MEKLMKRESDIFSQNSDDMDFNDVFGGPPKRFSMQERFSFESEEEKASSPWSGRKEKPVFGEEVRTRRRQNHQSDEFFNDIFKGVESYPSPRRSDRDSSSFGSNPGSRIMSPLPPKPDHFPTSLPAHFSLPAKVSKGAELPAFGSPLSRFSSRSNDHQSTPSYESCFDDSSTTKNEEKNAFNQFHFSIYKWAGKGVPMLNDFKSNMDIRFTSSFRKKQQSEPPVDKQETKDSVVLEKEQVHVPLKKKKDSVSVVLKEEQEHVPVKKKTEPLNNLIHAFPHHQEVKDKKPAKTPRVDEIRNRKVERSSSLKLEEMSEKKKKSVEKGNVKDFVQIFNQESGDHVAAKDEKLAHVSYKVVEDLYKPQPQPSQPPSSAETIHTDSKENAADDPLDADNFMVEEIFDTEESVAESESTSDETKAIDAKIRQWAVGKKGNIRSLLSTLQYVLWAESGWKTVPLVDLIEANSVKRAYQKALLRLHPDKLQQKGASFHHKYTAEKVFDILQEAWDHFNTSSLTM